MSKCHCTLESFRSRLSHVTPLTRCQSYLSAKTAIAAGVAWAAAQAVQPHGRPYFAPIAVVIIVQPTLSDSLSRAFQRVIGVILGVAAALVVSHFLGPSAWSIGIIVLAGLLLGRILHLGSQGVSQVGVTGLLVFLLGRVTPGYGSQRIIETAIGAAVAVVVVLLSPSPPMREIIVSEATAPLRGCSQLLRSIGKGVELAWTRDEAELWLEEARGVMKEIDEARDSYEQHQVNARWNVRARGERSILDRFGEALHIGEGIAIHARAIARCLLDGSEDAKPMPGVSALLVATASAIDEYAAWVASGGDCTQPQSPSKAMHSIDKSLYQAFPWIQEPWRIDATAWLTFGTVLTANRWILAELAQASRVHEATNRQLGAPSQ
jgi:hypothetical protein